MKQRGFTVIEFLIVLTIFGIVAAIVAPAILRKSTSDHPSTYSYGGNGRTEVRCIDGLKFVIGRSGSVQQMIGPNGGGIQCTQ